MAIATMPSTQSLDNELHKNKDRRNSGTGNTPFIAFSKSKLPLIGALKDYMLTSFKYFVSRSMSHGDILYKCTSKNAVSQRFLTFLCLILGLIANVKFEVVTLDRTPLPNDIHFVLMSKDDKLYVDDVDVSHALCCIEASDCLTIAISCLLILSSSIVHCPLSEYFFLPWLGVTLRGLLLRQAPTACAFIYTLAVVDETINPLFITSLLLLFMLEVRIWLDIARLVLSRWNKRGDNCLDMRLKYNSNLQNLWKNKVVPSVEVNNYVY